MPETCRSSNTKIDIVNRRIMTTNRTSTKTIARTTITTTIITTTLITTITAKHRYKKEQTMTPTMMLSITIYKKYVVLYQQ